MSKTKPSLPRGTRDFGPEVSAKRNFIIDKIKRNFIHYGFAQIETPALENLSVLTGKYGEEGDQLLYKILNSGDYLSKTTSEDYEAGSKHFVSKVSDKGLRYDLTVPFARFVVMNQNDITFPFKRFQIQPVWRADRPQKGRYREFYQCDADIVGSKGLWNEVELTLLLTDVFNDLGFSHYEIKINHREILFLLAEYVGLKGKEIPFCTELDKLDKIGSDQVANNLQSLGANTSKLDLVLDLISETDKNQIINRLEEMDASNQGVIEIKKYFDSLDQFDASKVVFDLGLARGLSYYTGMIYEVKPTNVKMGSISGGGRYDNLTGVFGLKNVSGIGVSFGLDRIYDVMEELELFPKNIAVKLDVLIVHFSEDNLKHGQQLVMKLRKSGVKADLYPEVTKIRKQFDYADKISAPYTLIVGDDEMEKQAYMLKNMETGEQQPLELNEIIRLFKG